MTRRFQPALLSGEGELVVAGRMPTLAVVTMKNMHIYDQYTDCGRPLWCVRWACRRQLDDEVQRWYEYGQTMTPTYAGLSVICVPPIQAVRMEVGVRWEWRAAKWTAAPNMITALRLIREGKPHNPVSTVFHDCKLTHMSVQRYAVAGVNGGVSSTPSPVVPILPKLKEHIDKLADDGCPHVDTPGHIDPPGIL